MKNSEDLIFVALNGKVVALDRDTGEILWQWQAPHGREYMTLLPDRDRLIVSYGGYMYALDPATGQQLWENPLKGFGWGVAALATLYQRSPDSSSAAAAASAQAAQAAATTVIVTS
jgi:hypothetical protein